MSLNLPSIAVVFAGSRELVSASESIVAFIVNIVKSVVKQHPNAHYYIGDCIGGDAIAGRQLMASGIEPNRIHICTLLKPDFTGGWKGTDRSFVKSAYTYGCDITWNVYPKSPLKHRLRKRSTLVQEQANSAVTQPSSVVFIGFLSHLKSKGTHGSADYAASRTNRVFLFAPEVRGFNHNYRKLRRQGYWKQVPLNNSWRHAIEWIRWNTMSHDWHQKLEM